MGATLERYAWRSLSVNDRDGALAAADSIICHACPRLRSVTRIADLEALGAPLGCRAAKLAIPLARQLLVRVLDYATKVFSRFEKGKKH